MIYTILHYLSIFLAILILLPMHEFAHAFVAVKSGDNTPKMYGRYTLNPLAHFDIFGLVSLLLVRFGWAKPMPINPNNFRHYKTSCFLVSIAGILMNYLLAFLAFPIFNLLLVYVIPNFNFGFFDDVLFLTFYFIYTIGISLSVFNLLPFYPLDGFRAIDVFVKNKYNPVYRFLRLYGRYILLGFIFLGIIANATGLYYLDVLGNFINFVGVWFKYPIELFWGLIL